MHVAVARVHVQGDKHPALQHALVNGGALVEDGLIGAPGENLLQRLAQFHLPRSAGAVVLQRLKNALLRYVRVGGIQVLQQPVPAVAHVVQQLLHFLHAVSQPFAGVDLRIVRVEQRQFPGEKGFQLIHQLQLVGQRQFDVDALDAVAVITHARQRNHHVLVDFEGVGVTGNGRSAGAIQPEFFTRFIGHGHKAFAVAQICQPHDFRRRRAHGIGAIADHIGNQHHLGARAPARLGGITDRLQITLVQMLQPG